MSGGIRATLLHSAMIAIIARHCKAYIVDLGDEHQQLCPQQPFTILLIGSTSGPTFGPSSPITSRQIGSMSSAASSDLQVSKAAKAFRMRLARHSRQSFFMTKFKSDNRCQTLSPDLAILGLDAQEE